MFRTLLTATALSGVMALSANALELGAGFEAGISFDDGISVNADVNATADAGISADAQEKLTAEGYAVTEGSTFIGNTVQTSDGVVVGTVTDVWGKPDAEQRARIVLTDEAGLETPHAFWLSMAADADADGTLVLPWTLAEFQADMATRVQSNG